MSQGQLTLFKKDLMVQNALAAGLLIGIINCSFFDCRHLLNVDIITADILVFFDCK